MTHREKNSLSPLENKVMNVVWQRQTATADDVRSALVRSQPMKDSTVRTICAALRKKDLSSIPLRGGHFTTLRSWPAECGHQRRTRDYRTLLRRLGGKLAGGNGRQRTALGRKTQRIGRQNRQGRGITKTQTSNVGGIIMHQFTQAWLTLVIDISIKSILLCERGRIGDLPAARCAIQICDTAFGPPFCWAC